MGHKRNSAKAVRRQLQALVRLQPLRRDLEQGLESDGLNMADPTLYSDVGAHPVSVAGLYDGYRVGAGTLECSLEARRITGSEGVDEGAVLGYAFVHPWIVNDIPKLNEFLLRVPSKPDCLLIHDVAVLQHARGMGASKALLELIAKLAKEREIPTLVLVLALILARLYPFGRQNAKGRVR